MALYQLHLKKQIVEVLTPKKNRYNEDVICICKLECWMIGMLTISLLGVREFLIMKKKKFRLCKGYFYSNASHIMLFMSDIYRYIPIQISNVSGDKNLFKLKGTLDLYLAVLRKNYIWKS